MLLKNERYPPRLGRDASTQIDGRIDPRRSSALAPAPASPIAALASDNPTNGRTDVVRSVYSGRNARTGAPRVRH